MMRTLSNNERAIPDANGVVRIESRVENGGIHGTTKITIRDVSSDEKEYRRENRKGI